MVDFHYQLLVMLCSRVLLQLRETPFHFACPPPRPAPLLAHLLLRGESHQIYTNVALPQ